MKHYLILSTLTDEGRRTVKKSPERIQQVNKAVEGWGIEIISQYALLGQYDFITIVRAEDEKAVLRAAMELGSRGTVQTMSIPAVPIDEYIKEFKGMK